MRKRELGPVAWSAFLAVAVTLLSGSLASAQQQDLSKVRQKAHQLTDTIWWLEPQPPLGGNLAVSAGEDGILMVDDQMMEITDNIKETVAGIQKGDIDFVVNSHYHFDHAGGNAAFGFESLIIAHASVRERPARGARGGSPASVPSRTPEKRCPW